MCDFTLSGVTTRVTIAARGRYTVGASVNLRVTSPKTKTETIVDLHPVRGWMISSSFFSNAAGTSQRIGSREPTCASGSLTGPS